MFTYTHIHENTYTENTHTHTIDNSEMAVSLDCGENQNTPKHLNREEMQTPHTVGGGGNQTANLRDAWQIDSTKK